MDRTTSAPHLKTERLEFDLFAAEHLDALHALWTDREVRRFLWDDQIVSREVVAGVIESSQQSFQVHGLGSWLLRLSGREECAGFASLRHFDAGAEVEILYGLAPPYWRRGLATEAAERVLRFAFEDLKLEEIFAGADPPNVRSFRVMKRLGFQPHGRRVIHGIETDYYSMTRRQFLSLDSQSLKPKG